MTDTAADRTTQKTLDKVASFYDGRKVGDVGPLGFRRSTDLATLRTCISIMMDEGLLRPGESSFLDLGCADGRVNVFMSYLVKISAGIEMDEWTLEEYEPLKQELEDALKAHKLKVPPENIFLFPGDALDSQTHLAIRDSADFDLSDFDLFYTYLIMHEEFSRLVLKKAKRGAIFMVYGLDRIMPRYEGLRLIEKLSPLEGILALYRKI